VRATDPIRRRTLAEDAIGGLVSFLIEAAVVGVFIALTLVIAIVVLAVV
jgi:hypothetical protein